MLKRSERQSLRLKDSAIPSKNLLKVWIGSIYLGYFGEKSSSANFPKKMSSNPHEVSCERESLLGT